MIESVPHLVSVLGTASIQALQVVCGRALGQSRNTGISAAFWERFACAPAAVCCIGDEPFHQFRRFDKKVAQETGERTTISMQDARILRAGLAVFRGLDDHRYGAEYDTSLLALAPAAVGAWWARSEVPAVPADRLFLSACECADLLNMARSSVERYRIGRFLPDMSGYPRSDWTWDAVSELAAALRPAVGWTAAQDQEWLDRTASLLAQDLSYVVAVPHMLRSQVVAGAANEPQSTYTHSLQHLTPDRHEATAQMIRSVRWPLLVPLAVGVEDLAMHGLRVLPDDAGVQLVVDPSPYGLSLAQGNRPRALLLLEQKVQISAAIAAVLGDIFWRDVTQLPASAAAA